MPELTPNYKFKKPIPDEEVADITVINENFDINDNELKKANDSIKNLENNKQNKEDSTLKTAVKKISGAINELYDELVKKATKTQLGRIKIGNNLTVDEDGTLHGNPGDTHPTGNGNNHIPVNGATGNFLKWLSSGAAQWVNITWDDIGSKPSSFPPGTHTHDDRYFTESEIDTKFKNFCPFPINSLYLSLGNENPSTLWLGTTWQKQEGRFLLGSSSSYSLGATGGASTVALSVANMPSHTHSASQSAHTHSQPTHTHTITGRYGQGTDYRGTVNTSANNTVTTASTDAAGGDTTGSSAPSISVGSTGSGTAFSILPPYLVVNIWKRLS